MPDSDPMDKNGDAMENATMAVSVGSITLNEWLDSHLPLLWHEKLSTALAMARELYAPDNDAYLADPDSEEKVSLHFWRLLIKATPRLPDLPEARFRVVVQTIQRILNVVRQTPTDPFAQEFLVIALRPIRRLALGGLTDEVCAALIDYHSGHWTPYLTRPQLYAIENTLAKTVAALPPNNMEPFWELLNCPDPRTRNAMLLGLRYISAAHAVSHLLHGLEHTQDHALRAAFVDHIEKIGEPSTIPTLTRLRRETAATDWPLSRQIGRAIRVIEKQNAGGNYRTLLRPATPTPTQDEGLLRPAIGAPLTDSADLLRSPIPEKPQQH
jgi:hypothetical protein